MYKLCPEYKTQLKYNRNPIKNDFDPKTWKPFIKTT